MGCVGARTVAIGQGDGSFNGGKRVLASIGHVGSGHSALLCMAFGIKLRVQRDSCTRSRGPCNGYVIFAVDGRLIMVVCKGVPAPNVCYCFIFPEYCRSNDCMNCFFAFVNVWVTLVVSE